MKKVVAMVAVLGLVSGACSGEDDAPERPDTVDDAAEVETGTEGTEENAGGDIDVEQALLTLEDLPVGWTTSSDAGEEDEGTAELCDGLDITDDEAEAEAEALFEEGDTGPFVSHAVARFDGGGEARFAELRQAIEECGDFDTTDEEGNSLTGRVAAISFPELGEESLAVRLSGTVTTVADPDFGELELLIAGDLVYFRQGDVVAGLFHYAIDATAFGAGGGGLDPAVSEELAREAAERLTGLA